MNREIEILSVNRSEQKGTIKLPCRQAEVNLLGLAGDAHAGPGLRQVSLLDKAAIDRFAETLGRYDRARPVRREPDRARSSRRRRISPGPFAV